MAASRSSSPSLSSSSVRVFKCAAIAAAEVVTFWAVALGSGPVEEMVRWRVASSAAWVRVELPVQVIRSGPGGMMKPSQENPILGKVVEF